MKVFVIHRFEDNNLLKLKLKKISKKLTYKIDFIFLDSFNDKKWRLKAEEAIIKSDLSIIYREDFCIKSNNAKWEVDLAKEMQKEVFSFDKEFKEDLIIDKFNEIYHFTNEFNKNFDDNKNNVMDLYKIMLNSSEKLIERRQKTNAFFITVIGAMIAITTFIIDSNFLGDSFGYMLVGFMLIAVLICKSWYNLIDNYGKLNKAKFDVILRLEEKLDAQIYNAEWVALGKGLRPKKYKSFTSTEKKCSDLFRKLVRYNSFNIFSFSTCSVLDTINTFRKGGKKTCLRR